MEILCTQISVDCVKNDSVDIRCGGPSYLGFDFNVPKDKLEEMKRFVIESLKIFEVPIQNIYNTGNSF